MLRLSFFFAVITYVLASNTSDFIEANEYFFSTVQASYFQAYAMCKENGWTLATARTSVEENRLNVALNRGGVTYSFWLGGFYVRNQQFLPTWLWLDYGQQINYTNWATDQPLIPDSSEYCLAKYGVGSEFGDPGKWLSNLCSYSVFFVCQRN